MYNFLSKILPLYFPPRVEREAKNRLTAQAHRTLDAELSSIQARHVAWCETAKLEFLIEFSKKYETRQGR